ncbi:MAG TPA: hypothetical protein VGL38_09510 [bacterium]
MKNEPPLDCSDVIAHLEKGIESEKWITVYSPNGFTCILAPNSVVPLLIGDCSWDTHTETGLPNVEDWRAGYQAYNRNGGKLGLEPLVIVWDYNELREPWIELCEEFRLFYNLWFDSRRGEYVTFLDDGTEQTVARIAEDRVLVRADCLKEFLAAKQFTLILYFDEHRRSGKSLDELNLRPSNDVVSNEQWCYCLDIWPVDSSVTHKSRARLCGKRFITAPPTFRSALNGDLWEGEQEFIVGTDADSRPILLPCTPDSPNAFAPVFFRREVLTKYLADTQRYTVEDGQIICGSLWSLRIDNNHPDFVVVFLGDLGKYLPASERAYWRSFNIAHDGGISPVTFKRAIMAEFTNPEQPDLLFKQRLRLFGSRWTEAYGWPLFKPLGSEDAHNLDSLTIPLHNNQKAFDEQVMSLAKCLIESINVAAIGERVKLKPKSATISVLDQFLESNGAADRVEIVKVLRNMQDLRDGAGHRKGERYARGAAYFKVDEIGFTKAFAMILRRTIWLLEALSNHFLPADSSKVGD